MENVLVNKMKLLKIIKKQNCFSAKEIIEEINISKRTFHRYIDELKDCGAEIIYNRQSNSYCLLNDFDLIEWINEYYV